MTKAKAQKHAPVLVLVPDPVEEAPRPLLRGLGARLRGPSSIQRSPPAARDLDIVESPEAYAVVYARLVAECNAKEDRRADFLLYMAEPGRREFRFSGNLGFGGKLSRDARGLRVSCYQEDETPDRVARVKRLNAWLASRR